MKKDTIEDAIKTVLKRNSSGLTPNEITEKIVEQKLYDFNTDEPETVVDRAIRKSLVGVNIQVSKDEEDKSFKSAGDGKYKLRGD
jgi:hypothetical protein